MDILIEEVIPEGSETEEVKEEAAQAETTDEDTAEAVHEGGRIAWTPSEKEEEVKFAMEHFSTKDSVHPAL